MDFTKITCISESCKNKNIIMGGAGGQFGSRMTIAKVKCPECNLVLMIVPMSDQYEYSISATTKEERIAQEIKRAKEKSELELAREIAQIKERGY